MYNIFNLPALAVLVCHIIALTGCTDEETVYNCILPDEVRLHEGDIVFRRGGGIESHVVMAVDRRGNYSHVGIVIDSAGIPMVVHAVPGEPDFKGDPDRVKMDVPDRFFSTEFTSIGEVCRVADTAVARRAAQAALGTYKRRTLFDHNYDDRDTNRMYCTELIVYAYHRAGLSLVSDERHEVRLPMFSANCIFPSDIRKSKHLKTIAIF